MMPDLLDMPTPTKAAPAKFFGARIDQQLFDEVRAEQLRRGLTFRQVVEWSFTAFLRTAATPQDLAPRQTK